ncbi:Na-translocating system protein MpsC family protein [Stieleria maiorica]|nr:Na-translocating system protein MpsC family protein [Stieleria maiorica]
MTQQLARVASTLQRQRTGVAPKTVTATLCENTLVVTMEGVLTPAEQALAQTPPGVTQVQEFHRQLFASSSESMREKIKTITGRDVREEAAEIQTDAGTLAHLFKSGAMVQVFILTPELSSYQGSDRESLERADDDGFHLPAQADGSEESERA